MVDEEIAAFFEVAVDTINEWKKVYPLFSAAIKRGKSGADIAVANALRKRALGYKVKEVTYEKVGDETLLMKEGDASTTLPLYKKKVVLKEIPGEVVAQFFWLKNRHPKLWRDKKDVAHSLDGPVTIIYEESAGNAGIKDDE